MKSRNPLTPAELEHIRGADGLRSVRTVAAELGRARSTVKCAADRMGVYLPPDENRPWTRAEDARLLVLLETGTVEQVAAQMPGRTTLAITGRLRVLGVSAYQGKLTLCELARRCGVCRHTVTRHARALGIVARSKRVDGRGLRASEAARVVRRLLAPPPQSTLGTTARRLRSVLAELEADAV